MRNFWVPPFCFSLSAPLSFVDFSSVSGLVVVSLVLAGALNRRNSNSCSSSSSLAVDVGCWGSLVSSDIDPAPIKASILSSSPSLAWASWMADSSTGDGERDEAGDWTSSRRTLKSRFSD